MTFGIINLVFSFFAVLVMDVGGAVLTFIVGSAATTSSVMYVGERASERERERERNGERAECE